MADITKLDLSVILPDIPDEHDRCVSLLIYELRSHPEIEEVQLSETDRSGGMAMLEVSYKSDSLSASEVEKMARSYGVEISKKVGHLEIEVNGVQQERRNKIAADLLKDEPGIFEADPVFNGKVRVEYDKNRYDDKSVRELLTRKGIEDSEKQDFKYRLNRFFDFVKEEIELVFSILCGVLLTTGWILATFTATPWSISLGLYVGAYFFGGYYTSIDVYQSLKGFKFNIHLLMLVAAIGAAILGHWAEGALLLFLFSLGHALEHYAMGKARRAIKGLSELTPHEAVLRDGGELRTVPIEELKPGDVVLVKPGERFPADGFVIKGQSDVDQSPITGESIPVDKNPVTSIEQARKDTRSVTDEHKIFAGSINGSSALDVELTGTASDSTLARVVQLVQEAQTHKSPTQRFAEKFEKWFVPVILVLVGFLHFAWVIIDEPFSASFYRAMAVMVAASPCALAISTPSAILSGIARAAKIGILVKGGGPLEQLGTLNGLAFDKTGTLTEGDPKITEIVPASGFSEAELLQTAIAVEQLIDHPLARSVVRDGTARLGNKEIPVAQNAHTVTGKGIEAEIGDEIIRVGKPEWFLQEDQKGLPVSLAREIDRLSKEGNTMMVVQKGEHILGAIALMDTPRSVASEVIAKLKAMGINEMIMISGDHQHVADAIGKKVGIDKNLGGLLPEDKVEALQRLQKDGRRIGMVGDGINDAPAMATSSVGIAMGAAGSDVALETADVALMADNLDRLPSAVGLGRYTRTIIKQNLWISLGMIAFLVPVTMMGYANMAVAVLLHEGSTLVVVLNALRLLGYKG